jgi:hypothetical protein
MNNSVIGECKPTFFGAQSKGSSDSQSLVSLAIFFCCVLYSSIRTSTHSQVGRITGADQILMNDTTTDGKYWNPIHINSFGLLLGLLFTVNCV